MKAREFTPCLLCGKGIAHNGDLTFLRVRIDYMALISSAIRRQHGLEQMIGNAAIASVMGPDESLATRMTGGDGLICGTCMISSGKMLAPFQLLETLTERQELAAEGGK